MAKRIPNDHGGFEVLLDENDVKALLALGNDASECKDVDDDVAVYHDLCALVFPWVE
jgi:hypothetical protein